MLTRKVGSESRQLVMCRAELPRFGGSPGLSTPGVTHGDAHCAGGCEVRAAIALPPLAFLQCGPFKVVTVVHTVANLLLYIDKCPQRLSWTWLLPRVFELTGIRDLLLSFRKKRFPLVDYG